jgi:hypothetical protein
VFLYVSRRRESFPLQLYPCTRCSPRFRGKKLPSVWTCRCFCRDRVGREMCLSSPVASRNSSKSPESVTFPTAIQAVGHSGQVYYKNFPDDDPPAHLLFFACCLSPVCLLLLESRFAAMEQNASDHHPSNEQNQGNRKKKKKKKERKKLTGKARALSADLEPNYRNLCLVVALYSGANRQASERKLGCRKVPGAWLLMAKLKAFVGSPSLHALRTESSCGLNCLAA